MAAPLVQEERNALAPRMIFTRLFALLHTRESPRRLGELSLTGMPVAFCIGADRSPRILRERWFAGRFSTPRLSFRFAAITRLRSGFAVTRLSFVFAAITRLRSGSAVTRLSFVLAAITRLRSRFAVSRLSFVFATLLALTTGGSGA